MNSNFSSNNNTAQDTLLARRVQDIYIRAELEKKLNSGKKLIIKLGRDPRKPDLHLGHAVSLRKLREFQNVGHQVVIVIGDFTARLGDPADANSRNLLLKEDIEKNISGLKEQFLKILDPGSTKLVYNSKWLEPLNFGGVIKIASNFTVQQNMDRDLFQKRLKNNQPIGVHEFLYPLMQAYDSVELKPDLEVGGNDQTFNLLAGRTLMKAYGETPQDVLTTPMLEGTDGREMHSSWGNTINLTDKPTDMYGKLMSVRDELILKYLLLTTNLSDEEISQIDQEIKSGKLNPMNAKKRLAQEVVTLYYDETAAKLAQEEFERVIQSDGIPQDKIVFKVGKEGTNVIDLLFESGLTSSKNDAKRLVESGAVDLVKLDHQENLQSRNTVSGISTKIAPDSLLRTIVQVGKRRAVEITS